MAEILKIKLPRAPMQDTIAWHYEKTGIFSVRSAYRLATSIHLFPDRVGSSSTPDGARKVWKKLWKLNVPPKVRVSAWKVASRGLPARALKKYRHLETDGTCELCGICDDEDAFHAVAQCPHAVALRQAVAEDCTLPDEDKLRYSGREWLLMLVDNEDPQVMANLVMVFWRAWDVRNGALKAGKAISIEGSVVFLKSYIESLMGDGSKDALGKKDAGVLVTPAKRSLPPRGRLKVNVDGAFIPTSGAAGIGVVVRDHQGQPLLMAWRKLFHCRDAEEAEMVACLEAVRLAGRLEEMELILETDCASVHGKLCGGCPDRSQTSWSSGAIRRAR